MTSRELGEFAGGAFDPRLPRGKASGVIELTSQRITCQCEGARVELPLSGLEIKRGGANNRLVFFSHPSFGDVSIYTADRAILKTPELNDLPELSDQIGGMRWKRRGGLIATAIVLGIIGAGLFGLYLLKEPIVGAVVRQIPVAWEDQLGDTLIEQMRTGRRFIGDESVLDEVRELVQPLLDAATASSEREYTFEFHILEDSTLNAFALPGGQVTIHSGLLLAADRPEQVLGVLAHEIAHVTRQHGMRNVVGSAGIFMLVQAFLGDASGVLAVIADNSGFFLNRKFSRDYERDADQVGWDYLVAANIEPLGMIEFFEKLKKQHEELLGDAEGVLSIFSTHPATEERIASLRQRWDELERHDAFRDLDADFSALKDRVRKALQGEGARDK